MIIKFKIKILILLIILPTISVADIHQNVIFAINKELISSGIFGPSLGEGTLIGLVRGNRYIFDPETSYELKCDITRFSTTDNTDVSCTLKGERYSGGTWINSAQNTWDSNWQDKGYKIIKNWEKGDASTITVSIYQELKSVTNYQLKQVAEGEKGNFKKLLQSFNLDSSKYFFVKAHGKYAEKYDCYGFDGCIFHVDKLKNKDILKKQTVKQSKKIERLKNGNQVISQYDSDKMTTYQNKIFKNKYLNKKFVFIGKVHDIVSPREIDLMLDYSNYATVKFNEDIPVDILTKESYVKVEGLLTFFGSGIIFRHTISNSKLIDYK